MISQLTQSVYLVICSVGNYQSLKAMRLNKKSMRFLNELCDRLAPHIAAGNIKLAVLGEDAALLGAAFTSMVPLHPTR
jgi:hypothetical protein